MLNSFTFRLVAVCAVMVCTVGCNAFNDHNKEAEILSNLGVYPEPEKPAEEKVPSETPADEEVAPPAPKVVCKINASVAVTTPEEGASEDLATRAPNTLNGETSLTLARWIDDKTTMITTGNDSGQLVITIQKQADGTFGLCDAVYTQNEESLAVASGTITVDKFNSSEEKKTINAGSYELTFAPSTEATKAAQILLGKAATASKDLMAAGNYYSESLIIVAE